MKTNGRSVTKTPPRNSEQGATEFYRRFRPAVWEEMYGQKDAVSTLKGLLEGDKFPHACLFTGPSGCGKTTAARIVRDELGVDPRDCVEINAASDRGIDMIRKIAERAYATGLYGKRRMWILDEAHQLTKKAGGDAQTALLKVLEDAPDPSYYILCTTDPAQLLTTIRTRCTEVKFAGLSKKSLRDAILDVADRAGIGDVSDTLMDAIAEAADGSARKAIVLLDQIAGIPDEQDRLDAVLKSDTKRNAFDLVRMLLWEREKPSWGKVAKHVLAMDDGEDWEGFRRLVLKCATGEILKAGKMSERAAAILDAFRDHVFDCGKAGIVLACYNLCRQ